MRSYFVSLLNILSDAMPLLCMIFGAIIAKSLRSRVEIYQTYDSQRLSTIGELEAGINILRVPSLRFDLRIIFDFIKSIPISLVAFLESISIAKRFAYDRGKFERVSH